MKRKYFYLIHFQFLGFRYHGWQKQLHVKTVQGMIEKTLTYILKHNDYRIIGASRTDAMVSVNQGAFELLIDEQVNKERFLIGLNQNLPQDIKANEITEVDRHFNIIQHPKIKEYLYLFSFGEKNHPFCAPFMMYTPHSLNISRMKLGAKLFEGVHNFRNYCYKPSSQTVLEREIISCEVVRNTVYEANFFPEESYMLRIRGKGFLRHQVRLIMGTLLQLGSDELSLDQIKLSLTGATYESDYYMAPSSALILNQLEFYEHDLEVD